MISLDDLTLDLLEAALDHAYTDEQAAAIRDGGDPPAGEMNLTNLLGFLSGYDPESEEPQSLSETDVIRALIREVRRLRKETS